MGITRRQGIVAILGTVGGVMASALAPRLRAATGWAPAPLSDTDRGRHARGRGHGNRYPLGPAPHSVKRHA